MPSRSGCASRSRRTSCSGLPSPWRTVTTKRGAEEDHDLADLDELVAVDVARGLQHDEQRVAAVDLELGALVAVDGVLDRQRVQLEVLADGLDDARARVVQADPDEAVLAGVGLAQRGLELDAPAEPLAALVEAAVDDGRADLLLAQLRVRGAGTVAAPLPSSPRRTGTRRGSGNQDQPWERTRSLPRTTLDPCTIGYSPAAPDGPRRPSASSSPRSRSRPPRRSSTRWSQIAPVVALGVVYLVAVLLVSSVWGGWLGAATALASALAFNFFHIPPTGRFTISEGENWVALGVFFVAAIVASTLAERARARTREAQERRQEADLAAEMARLLLRGASLDDALPAVSQRLAHALELPSAAIELSAVEGDERRIALAARRAGPWGRCSCRRRCRATSSSASGAHRARARGDPRRRDRARRAAARGRRDERPAPLRRAQDGAAARGLPRPALAADRDPHRGRRARTRRRSPEERDELVADIAARRAPVAPGRQPARPVAARGAPAEPRVEWCSVEEVSTPPSTSSRLPAGTFELALDADLPLIRADAAQLERAFANLLETRRATRAATRSRCAPARSARASSCASSTAGPGIRQPRRRASSSRSTAPRRRQRPPRLRAGAGDRARVRRGQRRARVGRVAARPGHDLRGGAPAREVAA